MEIDWEAVGAVSTAFAAFVALFVALLPMLAASEARKAKARNLSMRIIVKLQKIRPRLGSIILPPDLHAVPDHVILGNDFFVRTVSELESMLKESEVLTPKEQDSISQTVANLELILSALCSDGLSITSAKSIIRLIDYSVKTLEENGLLKYEPYQPWGSTEGVPETVNK